MKKKNETLILAELQGKALNGIVQRLNQVHFNGHYELRQRGLTFRLDWVEDYTPVIPLTFWQGFMPMKNYLQSLENSMQRKGIYNEEPETESSS